jgi:ribosome-binding factor A
VSTRTAQVEAAVTRVLSEAIHDLRDPRIPVVVTIEAVRVSADLQHARVYVSAIGDMTDLLAALEHARGFLHRRLAGELNLRRTPTLTFFEAGEAPQP